MIAVLIVIALLMICLFLLMVAFIDLGRGYRTLMAEQHTYCVSAVSEFVSDRLIAQGLRTLADKWDNVETQPLLTTLARERYQPGGPSMPAIWLNYEADRIDPPNPDWDLNEYTFSGERA